MIRIIDFNLKEMKKTYGYIVKIDPVPLNIYDPNDWTILDEWCKKNVGPIRERWDTPFQNPGDSPIYYGFVSEDDAILFKMVWG